ncbi:transporter substrate-binding domain-containing protein [Pseudomonas sp. Z4-20]|uniref:transporter substrate-binding domain-containing protein n=1 Tax=Pseudomonas sp. Z4-20 TaxID=2817414 RepID=UPI003DA9F649
MQKITLIGCTLSLLLGSQVFANEPPPVGTLDKIASSHSITLGYRDASVPFSYIADNSGKPMGYSVELANKVVERIKQQLALPQLNVKYNLVTSQTRIPLVQNGTVDLECGSTGVTAERQKQVAFSYGFIYVKGQLLTAKDSGIRSFADLRGKNVVTTAGTTNERFLKSYNQNNQVDMFVISAKDHGEAFPRFLALVNATLADLYKSGEINAIYDRWFQKPIPPKGLNLEFPMTSELKAIIAKPTSDPVK